MIKSKPIRCLAIETYAEFSNDRKYRYDLWRIWDREKPFLMVIGLNPSTANEAEDDPTIRRCKRFAFDWGFGGLCMMNLFAVRATKPKDMLRNVSPIGGSNDDRLLKNAKNSGMILAAWGANGSHLARGFDVRKLIEREKQMMCLGRTIAGQPRHPLYIKADTKPVRF